MEIWRPAYIGLGSNLADPRAQVLTACARLAQVPRTRVVLSSRLYRSQRSASVGDRESSISICCPTRVSNARRRHSHCRIPG